MLISLFNFLNWETEKYLFTKFMSWSAPHKVPQIYLYGSQDEFPIKKNGS